MKPVVLLLICATNLMSVAGSRFQRLSSADRLGISLLGLRFVGDKIGANTNSLSVRLGLDEEDLRRGKEPSIEIGKEGEAAVGETVAWALVVAFALTIGFRLGVGNSASIRPSLQITTPVSSPSPSTATNSPPASYQTKHFLFEDFSLDNSPSTPLAPVLFTDGSISEDCLETGRLKESFKDVREMWRDGDERVMIGRHTLEGKRYLLREKTVKSLKDLHKDALFLHTQSRLSLSSPHFLTYVTSWVESAPAFSSLKVITQVEFLSEVSLADLRSTGHRLTKEESTRVLKQIYKAVHFTEMNRVTGYDFTPERIYIDSHLKVKVADFDLKKKTNSLKSKQDALKMVSDLLRELSSNE